MTHKAFLDPAIAWSGALRRRLYADDSLAIWLQNASQTPVDQAITRIWFEELAGVAPENASLSTDDCRRVLRQLRERVFYTVMVRDIAGLADLPEVTGAMTTLADIAVEQAYRSVINALTAVHGVPRESSTGLPQETFSSHPPSLPIPTMIIS